MRYPAPKLLSHRAIGIKYYDRHSSPAFSKLAALQTSSGAARRSTYRSKNIPQATMITLWLWSTLS